MVNVVKSRIFLEYWGIKRQIVLKSEEAFFGGSVWDLGTSSYEDNILKPIFF